MHDAPEIDHRGQVPPYQQVAAWIRSRIESGELAPGAVLPSEKELIDTFGVGRTTVRRTMALLRAEGLITTVPQRGSYVAER